MSGQSTGTGNTGTEQILVGLYFTYGMTGWTSQMYRGCSSEFGTAQINTGSSLFPVPSPMGLNQVTTMVPPGTRVRWSATPDTANGFAFDCWYNYNTQQPYRTDSASGNYMDIDVTDPVILVPSFKPARPYYNRPISITVKGQDLSNAVEVSSMMSYYDYMLDSSVSGTTIIFNGVSLYRLPDNQPITLKVRSMNGYGIRVTVNGAQINHQESHQSSGDTGTSTQTGYRSGGSETSSGGGFSNDTVSYETYVVPNTGTSNMSIIVEYVSTAMEYTLKVDKIPTAVHDNTVAAYSGSEEPSTYQQQITVEEGTTVHALAIPGAYYNFSYWTDNPFSSSERTHYSTDIDYSFQLTEDVTLYGVFTQKYTTITAKADPRNGGTAKIYVDGEEQSSPIRSDIYSSAREITLVADANQDYTFIQWLLNGEEFSGGNQSSITVSFGADDKEYVAVFAYTPSGMVPFRLHTLSTSDGTHIGLSTNDPSVSFDTKYYDQYGRELSVQRITATEVSIESFLENDGGTYQTTLFLANNLLSPLTIDDGTRKYRYEFLKFAYRTYGEQGNLMSGWTDITLDPQGPQGYWILTFPNYIGGRIPTIELVAIYTKTLVYNVSLELQTVSGNDPSHSIWTTGSGEYASGETVTIDTGTNDGIDQNRYEFLRWVNTTTGDMFSENHEHSFTIGSDTKLTAIYQENCRLIASSENDLLGSVVVNTEPVSGLEEGWWPCDYEVEIEAIPESGAIFDSWRIANQSPTNNPISIRVSTDPTSIVGRFVESIKTIKVYSTDGGNVIIQTHELGGTEWETVYPMSGTTGTYSVPTGYSVRAVATPEFGYSFDGYVLYDEGSQSSPTEYPGTVFEIGIIESNKVLNASFKYIPWISKLTPIIKVY